MSGRSEFLIPIGLVALLVILFLLFSRTGFKNAGYVLTVLIFIVLGTIVGVKKGGSG